MYEGGFGGGFGGGRGEGGMGQGEFSQAEQSRNLVENRAEIDEREITMETMRDFNDAMELLAWIVEVAPGADADVANQVRSLYNGIAKSLGILGDDDITDWKKVSGMVQAINDRLINPIRKSDYPDEELFLKVFEEVAEELYGELSESKETFRGRMGKDLGKYLFGLGVVMSDEVVYSEWFPADGNEKDVIELNREGKPTNGRHRWATREILEKCKPGLTLGWKWVIIEQKGGEKYG